MHQIKEFSILACELPTSSTPIPRSFSSTMFATNALLAKLSFFRMMKSQKKLKKQKLQILEVKEIFEETKILSVKTFGIKLNYKTGMKNFHIYKEFRSISRTDAVNDLYQQMAGSHKTKPELIEIIEVFEVDTENIRRKKNVEMEKRELKFPKFRKTIKKENKNRLVSVNERSFFY